MEKKRKKSQSLTVYLLKAGMGERGALVQGKGVISRDVAVGSRKIGTLVIKPSSADGEPRWRKYFDGACDLSGISLTSAHPSAVLFVPVGDRTFALTFGYGRHLLEVGTFEERFGLVVTLNCIREDSVRSLDRKSFDAISRHTREQGSREASLRDFGLDVEQDLLRAVTGVPGDESLGKTMTGIDALVTSVPIGLEELAALLQRYAEAFADDGYLTRFPWVEHVREVRERGQIELLDQQLASRIEQGERTRIWMAVPEIIDWTAVHGFRYVPGSRRGTLESDLHLDRFMALRSGDGVLEPGALRRSKVQCIGDTDSAILDAWSVYDCLYGDLDDDGSRYLLNGSKWYRVQPTFYLRAMEEFKRIPAAAVQLADHWDGEIERDYNIRAAENDPELIRLDRELVRYGSSTSRFELCDLLSRKRHLIHVKRWGQSAPISHLCAQALNASQLLLEDDFREAVNRQLLGVWLPFWT